MDPESRRILDETYKLATENNKMLRKMRSAQKWATFWSAVRWLIIIGLTFGSFYFLEPYMNKVLDAYDSISGLNTQIKSNPLQDLLKKFDNGTMPN